MAELKHTEDSSVSGVCKNCNNHIREKLVELICDGTQKTEICTTDTYMDCETCRGDCGYCTILADHLIANNVTVQEWIPVTERLPEAGVGKVLVVKNYRGKPYVDIGEVIGGRAYCYSDEYAIHANEHKLTHWMPLPEAPKGE